MRILLIFATLCVSMQLYAQNGLFANRQYKKHFPDQEEWELFTLKGTDSVLTCMKYYFTSEDTIYFREYPSQRIHKISINDLRENPRPYGKDYRFARKNQNLNLSALKPKIFLGLSAASLAAIAVDLAQPVPFLGYSPQLVAVPLFFGVAYLQAKKMDRYLNYYQMADLQKFTKPELPKNIVVVPNTNQNVTIVQSQEIPANKNSTSISDEYRYGTAEVNVVKSLGTSSGCQYKLSDFYFESDGNYYFAIEGQKGSFYMKKDEINRLEGVDNIGKDRHFATDRFVLEKARTGKVLAALYGVGGTLVWTVAIGVATWQVAPAIFAGIGLGIGPAVLITRKCNATIKNYKIYQEALRVSCN